MGTICREAVNKTMMIDEIATLEQLQKRMEKICIRILSLNRRKQENEKWRDQESQEEGRMCQVVIRYQGKVVWMSRRSF